MRFSFTRSLVSLVPALALAAACSTAPAPGVTAVATAGPAEPAAVEAQRAWWRAFVLADSVALDAFSASRLLFVASTGHTFDRAGTIAEALANSTGSRLSLAWAEERAVRLADGSAMLVTARLTETEGRTVNHYRFVTVLERSGSRTAPWRVTSAQRTRELEFTPRIPAAQAGDLTAFAGGYRVPSGASLAIALQDSALVLTEPSGATLRLVPIGPSLFESTRLSASNGIVRFSFARDAQGRVVALSRLTQGGIITFPRADLP